MSALQKSIYPMKSIILLLALVPVGDGLLADDVTARIDEIAAWTAPYGEWQGSYKMLYAPELLLARHSDDNNEQKPIDLKLKLDGDNATVSIRFGDDPDWHEIGSESELTYDTMGWQINAREEGGVWIERWHLIFMWVDEDIAKVTVTRTVHNWHSSGENKDAPETYYVFGAGEARRVSNP